MKLITKSDSRATRSIFLLFAVLGGILVLVAGHARTTPDAVHAMWLGRSLVIGCLLAWTLVEDITVTLDDSSQRLLVHRRNMFWDHTREIQFRNIRGFNVLTMGRSRGPRSYQLSIELANSEKINTGRWSFDQAEILQESEELASLTKARENTSNEVSSLNSDSVIRGLRINQILFAGSAAVIFYTLWYRFAVGPWCPAMWFGGAPVLFIGFGFVLGLRLLRGLSKS